MTDLTKITTPFGLLDAETQEALKAHGGPYETWAGYDPAEWKVCPVPAWLGAATYRVKPQPPKPREWWIVKAGIGHALYGSRITALAASEDRGGEVIHVREVL